MQIVEFKIVKDDAAEIFKVALKQPYNGETNENSLFVEDHWGDHLCSIIFPTPLEKNELSKAIWNVAYRLAYYQRSKFIDDENDLKKAKAELEELEMPGKKRKK